MIKEKIEIDEDVYSFQYPVVEGFIVHYVYYRELFEVCEKIDNPSNFLITGF